MANIVHLPNISYVDGTVRVNINLSATEQRLREAQQWFGDRVLEDCRSLMPLQTGSLQQRSHTQYDGSQVVFPGPYARFQYGGRVMVDPVTHSPWARAGVKKILTERPLTYSNPAAVPYWFDEAKARFGASWIAGLKQRIGGR